MAATTPKFDPIVSIVGFHHARGPEVEHWIGVEDESSLSEWPLLPFMALSDGAHSLDSSSEDFSYFTLKHLLTRSDGTTDRPISLFGISCTRQLDSSTLINRTPEVTRSTVQKAVVVIADSPIYFGGLKEKLGMVTRAWFAQRNFDDLDIIKKFQESLKFSLSVASDQYLGLSLRELVFEFRQQTLVLFKCCLLQPKMLFFGSRCDRLCMTQFSLLSLIPGLLGALEDCADPELNYYEGKLFKPTSVRTSDRKSLLTFMGMPLQIFGKGSLFGPYTPLQQLDILADVGTKSYIVGSTNSLLLQQKDRYSDILINLDEHTVNITSSSLRTALYLTAADRRWIDSVVQAVTESWDENDPSRPNTMGFVGSEDYIRLQFEEYILSMVSSVKCHDFLQKHAGTASRILPDVEGDPALDFGMDFIDMWKRTENYRIFQKFTDSELFDLVPPKHVMAGGLTMDDVSRRISQQLNDLKLDEKMVNGREAVAKTLVAGRGKLGAAFSTLTNNVASLREAQAKKLSNPEPQSPAPSITPSIDSTETTEKAAEQAPPTKGGYFSAWASWAGEKKRKAFGGTPAQTPGSSPPMKATTNSETTSAAPSIGSPKVPVTNSRSAHAEDIYDAETGIGKGDSGFISPPYRASLDMHPQAQARRNTQEGKPDSEPPKGLFSVIAEQFQMVDVRKSLPPPPPPEKEPAPEVPEKSEEDKEFLRNLRKSLPPPPSEIDFLPDMLVTPGPPPGPLVAQEATLESPSTLESVISDIKPSVKGLPQNALGEKVETKLTKPIENCEIDVGVETSAYTESVTAKNNRSQNSQEQKGADSPMKESKVARLKARNLINQYVRQEKENEEHSDIAIEHKQSKGLGNAVGGGGVTETPMEAKIQEQVGVESPGRLRRESRTAGFKARDSLRQSFTQGTETQARLSSTGGVIEDGNSPPEARRTSIVKGESESKGAEPTIEQPVAASENLQNPRFRARGLIRKYVAQEQEAMVQKPILDQTTTGPAEEFVQEPKYRPRTRTLSQGESLRYSPTIPQTNPINSEPFTGKSRQSQAAELLPEKSLASPSLSQGSSVHVKDTTHDPITCTSASSTHSTTSEHKYSRSRDVGNDHPPIFKRKSIPAFPGSPIVESESPTRRVPSEPLKISKRRSTLKAMDDVNAAQERPEVTIQMKRKSLRSIGGEYMSLEASLKEAKERETKEREREEKARQSQQTEELHRALERERLEREGPDQERLEQERFEKERLEKERVEQERLEQERIEQERIEQERIEQERIEEVRIEEERLKQERIENERLEQERLEKERVEQERLEKEMLEQQRLEKERLEKERVEQERLEKERVEKERLEQERLEQERLEKERFEKERLEQKRLEQKRLEKRLEQKRLEQERLEHERLEHERLEQERLEEERLEKERLVKEKYEREELEKAMEREKEREIERKEREEKDKDATQQEPHPPSPRPLIKRKTIPAVFAQADAEMENKPKLSRATTGVGSLPRTPSPGLIAVTNISSTSTSPSERKIGGRSRSGTVAQGPPNLLSLNKTTSPPMPPLSSFKEIPKRGVRTPSPTKEIPPVTTEKVRVPTSITTKGIRSPGNDNDAPPLSPGRAAVAESRVGPGRIGGGLKDNPFLKNDLASPTSGSDGAPARKRVGTLKNNPFIKNDVKSPTSPPPAR